MPRLTALLQTMGGKVIACGEPSLGLAAKLANNYCTVLTSWASLITILVAQKPWTWGCGRADSRSCRRHRAERQPVPGVHMSAAPSSNGYRGGSTVQGPADEEGHWPGCGHGEKRGG
ncbi:hypothetical protein N656DRAFT_785064 [Canariomyces notabilis]|uniref:Uncharacterized protein n=1 Tax=Canariomyces notabilis TaxID=2074819 RepID=A0AAN6QCB1_9PEZI|nr:hypothetical protein N656DRAFT_785064 [Canariomyces arenarius]